MTNRYVSSQTDDGFYLVDYFSNPTTQRQKQYEAVRALVLEKQSVNAVAKRFGYKNSTIYSLLRDAKTKKIELFPPIHKGPQQRRVSPDVQNKIIVYRQQGLSQQLIYIFALKKLELTFQQEQ